MSGRVVHFEIPADNPGRAVKFYTDVFGWKIEKWGGPQDYWMAKTGGETEPGINGAIMRRQEPVSGLSFAIDVPSVDEFVRKVTAGGGKIVVPKMPVPGVGYMAYFQDTEGNLLSIFQGDPSAK